MFNGKPALVSVSGGRTSALMLYHVLDYYDGTLPDNVHVVFCNTSREHQATYKFLLDIQKYWNVNITCLEWTSDKVGRFTKKYNIVDFGNMLMDSSLFFECLTHVGNGTLTPNKHGRFCSTHLKQLPVRQYMRDQDYKFFYNVIGIRMDEQKRIKEGRQKFRSNCYYENIYPLVDLKITQKSVHYFWSQQPFDLELPIIDGKNPYGNCLGCFNKSEKEIVQILMDDINALDDMIEFETKVGKPFRVHDNVDYWLVEYKNMVKRNDPNELKKLSQMGLFCDVSAGSCTE